MSQSGLRTETIEQEDVLGWLEGENIEAEDAFDWIKGIGAATGPWGALIGAGIGAGLGALQTAQQQKQRPTPQPGIPSGPPAATAPTAPPPVGQPATGAPPGTSQQLLQQLALLLPLLTQLLAQQLRTKEEMEGEVWGEDEELEDSGDYVPDEAFLPDEETAVPTSPIFRANMRGIEGPIPDEEEGEGGEYPPAILTTPEYPLASRFVPAASTNYRNLGYRSPRPIRRVVIHITDGGPDINGPIRWFRNPTARVSAHYIVGQDGEIVQMVAHNNVAWHARGANTNSIGIEHVANTRGLNPTPIQYANSAALVRWLCERYKIPMDRAHIQGHSEADPRTNHTGCPNAVWNWGYYMSMVTSGMSLPPQTEEEEREAAMAREGSMHEEGPLEWVLEAVGPTAYATEW